MKFGECLKAARERAGLSQKELGKLLFVPASMIGRYETTDTEPRIGFVLDLCKALKTTPNELLNYKQFDPAQIDTEEDCKAAAEYWSNLLKPFFGMSFVTGKNFLLTALKDINASDFPMPIRFETISKGRMAVFKPSVLKIGYDEITRHAKTARQNAAIEYFVFSFILNKHIYDFDRMKDEDWEALWEDCDKLVNKSQQD